MQSGFNTNIRHRGVLFHVQTEDSGVSRPRVTTHLFRGGDIMASEEIDYADRLEAPELVTEVRALMASQHKAMLRALRAGAHDEAIVERVGPSELDPDASEVADPAPPAAAAAEAEAAETGAAERPLVEVVFEYLVENARQRKPRAS